jgi:hypothetical protein
MDLELDGNNAGSIYGTSVSNGTQTTLLRLTLHDLNMAFTCQDNAANNQYTAHDNIVTNTNGGVPEYASRVMWLYSNRASVQGNSFDGAGGGTHVLRFPKLNKAVISNNYITGAASGGEVIKMHSANYPTPGTWDGAYTEQVIVGDNHIRGTSGVPWIMTAQAQNGSFPEHLRNIIVERNYITNTSSAYIAIKISADDSTVRNNIVDMTNADYSWAINVALYGTQSVPNNVKVYANTIYSTNTGGNFYGATDHDFSDAGRATNSVFRNNLGVAPNASGPAVVSLTGGTNVQSNNLMSASPASIFVTGAPSAPADFILKALPNPARDTGLSAVPVWQDLYLNSRASPKDIGASEGQ